MRRWRTPGYDIVLGSPAMPSTSTGGISRIGPLARLAYGVSHGLRIAWFYSQYRLAARRGAPAAPTGKIDGLPSTADIFVRLLALLRRDLGNIEAGLYRMPHDWIPPVMRMLRLSRLFFTDLDDVGRRRRLRLGDEVYRRVAGEEPRRRYPRYYLQNFHYQTDGYLSDTSAALYDYQVEVLFYGGADAMRRQALVPLADFLRGRRVAGTRLLDIGAGTGRFLTFVKDNYPRLSTIALDLSPPYLRRAPVALGRDARTHVVNAAAEAMPLCENSIDVVTCIYLFHELPRKIRAAVAREIARVLRPGGRLIFVDSLQRGDDPELDRLLDVFPRAYHEPYYADYVRADLRRLFAGVGLDHVGNDVAFLSKVMTFDKR